MIRIDGKVLSQPPKSQILAVALQIFHNFVPFSTKFLSTLHFWTTSFSFPLLLVELLEPLFIIKYIHTYENHLPNYLQITVKLFLDDTSLLSAVYKTNISATQLESNLKNISHLTYKWKITFKSDLCQQAQIISARANVSSLGNVSSLQVINCNTVPVLLLYCYQDKYQKQLGLYLEEKLSFYDHFNSKLSKVNKAIGIVKRLLSIYPESLF